MHGDAHRRSSRAAGYHRRRRANAALDRIVHREPLRTTSVASTPPPCWLPCASCRLPVRAPSGGMTAPGIGQRVPTKPVLDIELSKSIEVANVLGGLHVDYRR